MATDKDFVDYVVEQAMLGNRITYKKMFGEYGLYLDETIVAFVCDNSLFLKPTSAADKLAPDVPKLPPYPGAKSYPVIDEFLDDTDMLKRLLLATADALSAQKPKVAKTVKTRDRSER